LWLLPAAVDVAAVDEEGCFLVDTDEALRFFAGCGKDEPQGAGRFSR
jgi:hypothetical protein